MPLGAARLPAALAVAAAALAGGCGAGVDDGAADNARSAVHVFLQLCAQERGGSLSRVLNGPALDVFMQRGDVRRGCAAVLRQPTARSDSAYAGARVTGVDVHGPSADVTVALPAGATAPAARTTVEAEREGDLWWVTNSAFGP